MEVRGNIMTRYVAVPVEVATNGDAGYLAWAEAEKMVWTGVVEYTYGHGSTEDEAFADLLAKLGYHEAKGVE